MKKRSWPGAGSNSWPRQLLPAATIFIFCNSSLSAFAGQFSRSFVSVPSLSSCNSLPRPGDRPCEPRRWNGLRKSTEDQKHHPGEQKPERPSIGAVQAGFAWRGPHVHLWSLRLTCREFYSGLQSPGGLWLLRLIANRSNRENPWRGTGTVLRPCGAQWLQQQRKRLRGWNQPIPATIQAGQKYAQACEARERNLERFWRSGVLLPVPAAQAPGYPTRE